FARRTTAVLSMSAEASSTKPGAALTTVKTFIFNNLIEVYFRTGIESHATKARNSADLVFGCGNVSGAASSHAGE
ncbi:hypothetical protein KUU49_29635, partial [Pseudomonas aeruginosa]|nr:hypothetical protein [Pseudomonas aeruginosa]